jgi:hypothetical protein
VVGGRYRVASVLALSGAALLAAGAREADPPRQVWFAPNLGSRDLVDLFLRPQQWPGARAAVDVFMFYAGQLRAERPEECANCGPNLLPALLQAQAFHRLREWDIEVAVETGSIKQSGCAGEFMADSARQALDNVSAGGGEVRYLIMDEPLLGSADCQLTTAESARQVAAFTRALRESHPGVAVGLVEPFPLFSVPRLVDWLERLDGEGARPAFFHLDVDRRHAKRDRVDVATALRLLEGYCRLRGIPFGVIFWGHEAASDRAYYDDTLAWVRTVHRAIGWPQHSVFQSWAFSADGSQTVPANVPESDPAAFSHTRLLLDALSRPR